MKIVSARFVTSAVTPDQYPDDLPAIAFVGRSNVGKSSFINCLTGRKNLARTSSVPGKTRLLNFYLINNSFYFVDFPGYGYAQVSKKMRAAWGTMIERFLLNSHRLRGVVQLVDIRHPPSRQDVTMGEWLKYYRMPTVVVATKADKIPKSKRQRFIKEIVQGLNIKDVYVFSSVTGEGKEAVWGRLASFLGDDR